MNHLENFGFPKFTPALKTFWSGRRRMSDSQEGLYGMVKGLSVYNDRPRLEADLRLIVDRFERNYPMARPLEKQMRLLVDEELTLRPSRFMANAFEYRAAFGADPAVEGGLNKNQLACKLWIVEALRTSLPSPPRNVLVLGGWIGALSALLVERLGWKDGVRLESLDLNPDASERARILLRHLIRENVVTVETGDLFLRKYEDPDTLVVNTVCEHILPFSRWWDLLPKGQLVLLQSNDYYDEPEHVNCVPSLEAFRAQAPLNETFFAGSFKTKNYTRFMLIGRK